MVWTTNQARHFYVTEKPIKTKSAYDALTGTSGATSKAENGFFNIANGDLYFHFADVEGRSDLIPLRNIEYVKHINGASYREKFAKSVITISAVKPSTAYVVHVEVCNQAGFGDEESFMFFGAYKTKSAGDTTSTTALGLAKSLVTTTLKYSSMPTSLGSYIGAATKNDDITAAQLTSVIGTAAYKQAAAKIGFSVALSNAVITITPVKPEFILGKSMDRHPLINVLISPEGDETTVDWAKSVTTPESQTPAYGNSQMVANMEYFYKKERGDQYDGALWPNDIKFEGNAKVNKAGGYDLLEIHYSYVGANEGVQKSEKDITIAAPHATASAFADVLNTLKDYTQVIDAPVQEVTTSDSQKVNVTLNADSKTKE